MHLPLSPDQAIWLAIPFGMIFGALLERGAVTRYDTIVGQFRLTDYTVLKVMLTAIVVGGIGVRLLHGADLAQYQIKPANLLVVGLGGLIFGVGMVIYGYCPGTGIAAVATGRVDALAGVFGMLAGGVAYGLSYGWIRDHLESVWSLGKVRLPELTHTPEALWMVGLAFVALGVFWLIEMAGSPKAGASRGSQAN